MNAAMSRLLLEEEEEEDEEVVVVISKEAKTPHQLTPLETSWMPVRLQVSAATTR